MSGGEAPDGAIAAKRADGSFAARVFSRLNARLLPRHLFHGPEWLVLGVNNACNLRCRMCDVGQAHDESNFARHLIGTRPRDMPVVLMQRIVEQARAHFPRLRLGFAFTEPLMYRHLVESVAMAAAAHLRPAVTTNGLGLETRAAELARAGLADLYLSLDGRGEVHDAIRGRQGAYRRAMAGVEELLRANPRPAISVFCVITPWNAAKLVELAEALREVPLTRLGFMHPNFTPEEVVASHNAVHGDSYPATTSNLGPFDPAAVDLERLHGELGEIRSRRWPFPLVFSPDLSTHAELERFYRRPADLIGRSCSDAFRALMIKADGSVIPAHGRCYDLTVGNIHQQSLREIWNAPALGRFRATLNRAGGLLPACSRCCSAF